MGYPNWSPDEINILHENWNMPMKNLMHKLPGRTRKAIYHRIADLGYTRQTYKRFSQEDDIYLRNNYTYMGNKEIGKHLKRTAKSIAKRMIVLGLKRTSQHLSVIGKRTNAGIFKKGVPNPVRLPIGYIRLANSSNKNNSGTRYEIKLAENHWMPLSRYMYQLATGEVLQPTDIIYYKDGNTDNYRIENLVKITRSELVKLNRMSDSSIVKLFLKVKDPALQQHLLQHHPELIDLKRKSLQVQHLIK